MSQNALRTGLVSQSEGSSGSFARKEMLDAAVKSRKTEPLYQDSESMNNSLYSNEKGEMMKKDKLFGIQTEEEFSSHAKEKEMVAGGQQQPVVKPGHYSDNTAAACSENNRPTLRIDGGSKDSYENVAIKREPDIEGETDCWNLGPNHPMSDREIDGEMHSSTLRHMNELPQDIPLSSIMNDMSAYEGHEFGDYFGLAGGRDGTEVDTHQGEYGVTIPTDEGRIQSEGPVSTEIDSRNDARFAVSRESHDAAVRSQQQYHGGTASRTADQMPDYRGRQIDQPSAFAKASDPRYGHETMQSGSERNMMSVTGEKSAGQHTQGPNVPMSGSWPTAGMNEIQHHQAFVRPIDLIKNPNSHPFTQDTFTPFAASNNYPRFQPPTHRFPPPSQQQPLNSYSQYPVNSIFAHEQHLQAQAEEKRQQLEHAKRLNEQTQHRTQQEKSSLDFTQNRSSVPPSFLMGPLEYPRAPQSGYRRLQSANDNPSYWPQMQSGFSQSQMVLNDCSTSYPTQSQDVVGKSIGSDRQTPAPSAAQDLSKTQQQDFNEDEDDDDEDDNEEDDEPLITRVKRQASTMSQTSNINTSSAPQDNEPLSEADPSTQPTLNNTSNTSIDWKLPEYDIQLQPPSTKDASASIPTAKVSLPGLVREELLLSPDHADQEVHLFVNVFLPAQQALATPDPAPAAAVLNFHTIALMVIEAYVQYEIGDELGRRNPYFQTPATNEDAAGGTSSKNSTQEQDYKRIRDARSADVDDIFFAVIDRWRAGRESNKKNLMLIRGVQEFCDVALDVIFHIKENGLLGTVQKEEEERRKKREKTGGESKGVREEGVAVLKARPKAKRAAPKEKAEARPRKRGKTAVAEGKKKKGKAAVVEPRKKGRPRKEAGITVVKRSV